jgi:hypothetical protein
LPDDFYSFIFAKHFLNSIYTIIGVADSTIRGTTNPPFVCTSRNLILSNIFLLVSNLKKRNKVLFFCLVKLKNSASKCAEAVNNKTEQQKCAALPAKSKIFIAQRRRRRKMQYNFFRKSPFQSGKKMI